MCSPGARRPDLAARHWTFTARAGSTRAPLTSTFAYRCPLRVGRDRVRRRRTARPTATFCRLAASSSCSWSGHENVALVWEAAWLVVLGASALPTRPTSAANTRSARRPDRKSLSAGCRTRTHVSTLPRLRRWTATSSRPNRRGDVFPATRSRASKSSESSPSAHRICAMSSSWQAAV